MTRNVCILYFRNDVGDGFNIQQKKTAVKTYGNQCNWNM